jgi:L-fuculose-phosphate aldolase
MWLAKKIGVRRRMNNQETKQSVLDTMNRVYRNTLTTTSGGNISAISDEGVIYITPSSIDKGGLTIDDIVEVLPSGKINGKHKPSIELPFHSNIYKLRPDIKGVVHAHAPEVVAYAIARKSPSSKIAPIYNKILGDISDSRYEIPGSLELGDIVKEEFEKGFYTVMMDSHGATVGGTDLNDAYIKYEALNDCADTMLNAAMLGGVNTVDDFVSYSKTTGTYTCNITDEDREIARDLSKLLKRSFKQRLVSSYSGTLASKNSIGEIIINPDNVSREDITENDFIKYKDGKFSKTLGGKEIDSQNIVSYIALIEEIFVSNECAKTVFISTPNAIMGFAVAKKLFNSRLIPETYIMLKDVAQVAHGKTKEEIAFMISRECPSLVIDNECVITIGKNPIKAFDRMEVIEFSARSVIKAKQIAEIVPINQQEVDDINRVFDGW